MKPNFLCGEAHTLRERFDLVAEKPGAFAVKFWLPLWLAAAMFWPLEPLQRLLGLPAHLSRETVKVGASHLNTRVKKPNANSAGRIKLPGRCGCKP